MKKIQKPAQNAIFAGSFDPLTKGHIWIIERSSKLFDKLTIVVRDNNDDVPYLSLDERVKNIQESVKKIENVNVISIENEFVVKVAKRLNATTIIRGIKNSVNYELEQNINHLNQDIDPKVITIFLQPPNVLMSIDSKLIKGIIGTDGWRSIIRKYVDTATYKVLSYKNLQTRIEKDFKSFYNLLQIAEDKKMITKMEKIVDFHSSKDRHYHDFVHLDELLDLVNTLKLNELEKMIIKMAIYYHDILYDSASTENEENSVKLMKKEWASELNNKFHFGRKQYKFSTILEEISSFILNTKKHRALHSVKHKRLLKIFLDIDLSILASDAERLWEHEAQIRQEFSGKTEEEFAKTRITFFEELMSSPRIYFSDEFEGFEAKAKTNLKLIRQKYSR